MPNFVEFSAENDHGQTNNSHVQHLLSFIHLVAAGDLESFANIIAASLPLGSRVVFKIPTND